MSEDYWKLMTAAEEFERYWNSKNKLSLEQRWGLVQRLAGGITKGITNTTVLDVGSGIGNLIAFTSLATKENYLGIDISPPMVERARALHPGYRFEVADPMKFDNISDLVVAHGVLLHQHDPFPLLRKLVEFTGSCLIFDELVTKEGYSRRSPHGYWTKCLGDGEYLCMKEGLEKEFHLEEVKFGEWGADREYYLSCRRI